MTAAVAGPPAAVQTRQVTIDNFTFSPAELIVPVGTKVVWVNHDDVPHNVVETTRAFSSPALDTDEKYAHVFGEAGTYSYFCGIHPHMTGRVVVK
jgi:plastocyanin